MTYLPQSWQGQIPDPSELIDRLAGDNVFPAKENILNALELTPLQDVKVVILGQDPYHTPGAAQGLAFSVPDGQKTQPSLRNILKELATDIGPRESQDLTSWAKQGVLLLNTVLTVEAGKANSHKDEGWQEYVDAIIKAVDNTNQKVVFILWGKQAQAKKHLIEKQEIIESPHPSPFSANRGFFGSKPFSQVNTYLRENNIREIDWLN